MSALAWDDDEDGYLYLSAEDVLVSVRPNGEWRVQVLGTADPELEWEGDALVMVPGPPQMEWVACIGASGSAKEALLDAMSTAVDLLDESSPTREHLRAVLAETKGS